MTSWRNTVSRRISSQGCWDLAEPHESPIFPRYPPGLYRSSSAKTSLGPAKQASSFFLEHMRQTAAEAVE